jgi:transposase
MSSDLSSKARDVLVGMQVRLENEIHGLLKPFGVMFGKRVGGFVRRAEEIIANKLDVAPELRSVFEVLVATRRDLRAHIKSLDSKVRSKQSGQIARHRARRRAHYVSRCRFNLR